MAPSATTGNRPRPLTILAAAFLAGGAAAVGLNYFLDVHLSQRKPVVESEPIFIAMRSLPAGAPVTVWDVALRNWPKAMLPTTAMRVEDSFEGMMLKMPIREGQPLLSVQLEPTLTIAKTSAGTAADDGGMVIVDDRTKVQVSWPSKPTKAPAATDAVQASKPADIASHSVSPADDRLAIRPITPPAVAEQAAPAEVEPAPTAQPAPTTQLGVIAPQNPPAATDPAPTVAASATAIPESSPAEPAPAVVPLPETNNAVVATPAPVVPVEATAVTAEPVVAEPLIAEPALAEPTIAEPVAQTQPQPASSIAAVPAPVAPTVPTIVQSQRHLVIPERIAVMVDDVTPAPTAPPVLADNTIPPSALRKVTPPATATQQPSATTSLTERDALSAAIRPNPLRPSTASPTATRPIVTPVIPTAPVENRVQPQANLNVPRVIIPRDEITPSRSGRDGSSTTPSAADANADSRLFPRVSARMEKAGDDWNRFRDSIFGSSEEESTGSSR